MLHFDFWKYGIENTEKQLNFCSFYFLNHLVTICSLFSGTNVIYCSLEDAMSYFSVWLQLLPF